jgi:carbon storage regulator
MLILTRRLGESIKIGDDVQITVLAVGGTQVRIGIDAPRSMPVDRSEVHERKKLGLPPPRKLERTGEEG